MNIVVKMGSL